MGSLISRAVWGIRNPRAAWSIVSWNVSQLPIRRRAWLLRLHGGHVGTAIMIQPDVTILYASGLSIGNNCYINIGTWILASGSIKIGDNVIIGPYAVLTSANHGYDSLDRPIRQQRDVLNPIVIEDDVWIGAHAVVLPGVTVGKGSVIGAGAVVTSDVPAYSVALGIPARVVKSRLERGGDVR